MNIGNRNFTNFQNLRVRGTAGDAGQVLLKNASTNGAWDGTVSIQNFGGSNEAPYFNVSNVGLNVGTGFIRFVPFGGSVAGTLSVNTTFNDTDRAWTLPSKSGTFGVSGTFTVNLPSVAALSTQGTSVVVAGLRAEDGLLCVVQNMGTTLTLQNFGVQGFSFLAGAEAANGGAYLTFVNPTTTLTTITDYVVAFTAVR